MMIRNVALVAVLAVVPGTSLMAADGYYKTKADERAGRLTPGKPPAAPVTARNARAGTDACPGTSIANPGAATFTDTGTTLGANNTVTSVQAGCSDYTTTAGPDVVYTYGLGALGARGTPLVIAATGSGGYDTTLFNLTTAGAGCPAGTAVAATNCINGSDSTLGNGTETITDAETDAMPAGQYFLFVDSFYSTGAASAGAYTLTFGTGPFPVELMGFSVE